VEEGNSGMGMRRYFSMLANYFVFPVASNRKQHEFFKAIVLAHEMTIALRGTSAPSFPDCVVKASLPKRLKLKLKV
jgi:hypothetical protein